MNWDQIKGNWMQIKGKAREQWGDLTDDDMDRIAGQRDQLVGTLQEKKGIAREEAERQADEWADVPRGSGGFHSKTGRETSPSYYETADEGGRCVDAQLHIDRSA
jgi:uncharacterized protein YjbJ (UPF0337 family)